MKKISLVILVLAGILVGCTHTEKTATGGAIAGAAVGAAIGGALGAGAGELTKNK